MGVEWGRSGVKHDVAARNTSLILRVCTALNSLLVFLSSFATKMVCVCVCVCVCVLSLIHI